MSKWEIVYIPEKEPVSTTEQPSVDAIAAVIDPKSANTIVRQLNKIAPLENLCHVKRVRKNTVEGGKVQLSVLLSLASEEEQQLESIATDILELVKAYQLSPFIAKVAKYAASSREEWKEQCKLWPTSYHPPTYNIDGITGFSEADSEPVFNYMKLALKLAKSGSQVVNAAVIVDPSVRQIISTAFDQTDSWRIPTNGIKVPDSYQHNANDVAAATTLLSKFEGDKRLYTGVCCLYPWKWTEHQLHTGNNCFFHPLQHAALVAIENAAARDRHLYPGSSDIQGCSFQVDSYSSSMNIPVKKQKIDLSKDEDASVLRACSNGSQFETERPYLCTGFDIYLVWEPCTMCAMALVHQRIRRIFYAFPNTNFGALGSVQRLQGEKSLNHHYAVFRILLPEDVLQELPSSDFQ